MRVQIDSRNRPENEMQSPILNYQFFIGDCPDQPHNKSGKDDFIAPK